MHPEHEKALLTWVNEMHAQAVNVSSEMMKEMEVGLLDRVNEMLPDEKKIYLTFSNWWLFKFQWTWGLRSWKSYGETGSGNEEAISQDLPLL